MLPPNGNADPVIGEKYSQFGDDQNKEDFEASLDLEAIIEHTINRLNKKKKSGEESED